MTHYELRDFRWDLPHRTRKPHIYLTPAGWRRQAGAAPVDANKRARLFCEAKNR